MRKVSQPAVRFMQTSRSVASARHKDPFLVCCLCAFLGLFGITVHNLLRNGTVFLHEPHASLVFFSQVAFFATRHELKMLKRSKDLAPTWQYKTREDIPCKGDETSFVMCCDGPCYHHLTNRFFHSETKLYEGRPKCSFRNVFAQLLFD